VADFLNIFKALNNLEILAGNDPPGAGPAVVFLVDVVGVAVNAPARFHLVVGALLAGKSKAVYPERPGNLIKLNFLIFLEK
jgi:hypothetical protein